MDLKETEILGEGAAGHWYYRSKARAMMKLLGPNAPTRVLDVGAGSGFFSRYLLANSNASEAWCVDPGYAENSDAAEHGKPLHFRQSIEVSNANTVLVMDVLEHVDDDIGLLREYAGKVPNGAKFLISVPAFQFLWSGHDVFLCHRRRYTIDQIEKVTKSAGLNVLRGTYYFGAVFPIVAAIRLAGNMARRSQPEVKSQLKRHSPAVNATLAALSYAELALIPHNRLVGLTAFCLAEKA